MKKAYFIILPILAALNCLIFYYLYCVNDYAQVSDIWGKTTAVDKRSVVLLKALLKTNAKNISLIETAVEEKIALLDYYLKAADGKLEKTDETYISFLLSEYKDNPSVLEADIKIYKKILQKVYYIKNYAEYVKNIPYTADLLSKVTLYQNNTDWITSNISKTVRDFYGLDKITVSVDNDEGLNLLVNHRISDIFAVLASIATAVLMFNILRNKTSTALIAERSMFAKGILVLFVTVFMLYAIIAVMTEVFVGLGDLNRSLQSFESFKNCVFILNTGTFLLLWVVSKFAACFIVYAAAVYIITSIKYKRSLLFTVMMIAAFFIAELIFYTSSSYTRISIMLREINFFSAFDLHRFFASYLNLNFFGQAVSRPAVFIVFISVILILSGIAAKKSADAYKAKTLAEAEKVYFDEINRRYTEFRGIWHDMQNHLLVLNRLIEDNDTESAKSYINEFNEKLTKNLLPPKTGQYGPAVLDALLYKKLETAESKGIDLKFDIAVYLSDFGITDYELCSIFGNVLDNAIDAVKKLPIEERWIILYINSRHDMLYICCENPYSGELVRQDDGFLSSKKDKSLHGIGLLRINGLAKTHNGGVSINTDGNVFKIEILLNSKTK